MVVTILHLGSLLLHKKISPKIVKENGIHLTFQNVIEMSTFVNSKQIYL